MTRALHLRAAATVLFGLALAACGPALAASAPLPPDEAYEATTSLSVANGTPLGGTLISDGRELLLAERQAAQGAASLLSFSIRDVANGQELRRLRPRPVHQWDSRWDLSADGSRLAMGVIEAGRHALVVIDVATDQEVQRLTLPEGRDLGAVAISPDARRVAGAVGGGGVRVHVWDIPSPAEPREIRITAAKTIDFSPDGARVLTAFTEPTGLFGGSSDGVAEVWDVNTGRRLTEVRVKDSGFLAALFSPDGTRILTANRGVQKSPAQVASTATLWDAGTGKLVMAIGPGDGPTSSVAFSADGARIATAPADRRVRVWDARTGALLARLAPHGSRGQNPRGVVYVTVAPGVHIGLPAGTSTVAAAFAQAGNSLVSAGFDGSVKVWVDVAEQRAAEQAAVTASLAQAQGGDAAAMHRLVTAYREGRGVAKNAALSSTWLTRAADAGHAPANVELGNLLVAGNGARQDCIEGGARLRKASLQGDVAAGVALDAVLSPVGGRQGAAAMSPQIQADLLETQIIDVLKRSEYPAFLIHLCALEALGHAERLPAEARRELVYHRAVGLQAAGKPKAALAALTQYLNEAGNVGANYTAAIRLLRPLQEAAK